MKGLKLQSVQLLQTVSVSSSTSSQTPLFRYSSVYKTLSRLWKNTTQTLNTSVCNHPKESAVAVSAPGYN